MTGCSRTRRPPSLDLSLSSRESSRSGTPESDDETSRKSSPYPSDSTDDRSCQMHIFPTGPYCFKQPTLTDVLTNTAPPPYTLSAFMAYLSQNHCLETLEFTMDANRYRKHYNSIANPKDRQSVPNAKDCAYVRKLWQKLLDAYIVPNGPREVNLPCSIRDQILSIPNSRTPPPPEALDPAVDIVHELMQESVLVPFLTDCQHNNAFVSDPVCPAPWGGRGISNTSDESVYLHRHRSGRRRRDTSPPSPVDFMMLSSSYSSAPPRIPPRTTSPFSAALGWHHHHRQGSNTTQSWTSNGSVDSMMADDSGSSTPQSWGSPGPMTPPTTPPVGEGPGISAAGKGMVGWKRVAGGLGRGLGWGRKKSDLPQPYW